jgi:hypothetical protein
MLKRGQKLCKYCKSINAARQRICNSCKNEFNPKNIPIKNEVKDWQNLQPGDLIKVIVGSGPYYISKKESENSRFGERIPMGEIGVYKVTRVVENGIYAFGMTNRNGGSTFIYMGKPYISDSTGLIYEPHRIKRVKVKCR